MLASSSETRPEEKSNVPTPLAKKEVYWVVIAIVGFVHAVAILSLLFYTPSNHTVTMTLLNWIFGGLGITAGYHRLWSHNAYKSSGVTRFIFALMGTMGFQGSIKWWSLRHRLHHRYTDTEHDPYNATRGFWYSHMGWLFEKPEYTRLKWIDKSDLERDKVVQWQHKNFPALAIMMCFILPTCLGALWGDALGGYLYGGFVSRIILWHTTWFINSLAHSWGEQEFSAENTSRGNHIIALLTMGEGHHNYHHEFPRDYRNGILAIDYDPTKWLIIALSYFGLTYDLIKIPAEVILKARVNACKDKIHEWNKHLIWSDEDKLPTWSYEEFANEAAQSKSLILIQDFAIDITEFASQHPGGEKLLNNYIAKDATKAFFGVLNNHTKSARQLMKDMRVAKVSDKPKQD